MAWISLSTEDVKPSLAGAELDALQTAALADGQADPVAAIITEVVNEIRGYIAACKANSLEEGIKIPEKLKSAAIAMIRYRSASRLPVRSFLTEARIEENKRAIRLLEQVARCEFAVEEPETPEDEVISSGTPSICAAEKKFSRRNQDGI